MPIFQRSSISSPQQQQQEAASEAQQQSQQHRQQQRSSLIASRRTSSSAGFSTSFHYSSSRYSSAGFDPVLLSEPSTPTSRLKSMLCCCCAGSGCKRPSWLAHNSRIVKQSKRLIRSRLWKLLMIFFYGFLVFGPQIYHIMEHFQETTFNILALVTFGFCLVDMGLRVLVEPNYFQFGVSSCCQTPNKFGVGNDNHHSSCVVGSFLFWCDLVSMAAILLDFVVVNHHRNEIQTIEIELDSYGFPVEGFDQLSRIKPVNLEMNLLITIARCARMARFVRSRTVVNASNQINWYWVFRHLKWCNPFFYYRRIRKQRRKAQLEAIPVGALDESTDFVVPTSRVGDKRTSWGVLQIGILAAVRAQAEAEAREARQGRKAGGRLWDAIKSPMQFMRKREDNTQMRQVAAIKIQRAWRSHVRFEAAMSTDGGSMFGDLGIEDDSNSFMNSHRSHSVNPLDRVQNKRSVLAAFAQMNSHAAPGGKLDRREIKASLNMSNEQAQGSRFQSQAGKGRESQVGSDMRELTGQRVALGVLLALIFTVVFTYTEASTTSPTTMIVLHNQTMNNQFRMEALYAARNSSVPNMYLYLPANDDPISFDMAGVKDLKPSERIRYEVLDTLGRETAAEFSYRDEVVQAAITEIVATLFIVLVWFFGVTAFAGPVMSLVVVPIERMVRLLGMLMMDPLGYQSTQKFKNFLIEEDKLIKNTRWTKEVLKGMETSFLMSTILRIGSLMKVGFGSAGVEIIRNNLQKGQSKNMLILTTQGSTVSCIFLFCDIRNFTDATECLQEEVFVFTNRIAAVVHSICHSYGGAANKNVGDAFLLSWSLEDGEAGKNSTSGDRIRGDGVLKAKSNQADKALLSVIKICISLYYDNYYLEPLSETARNKLKDKLKRRSGPVVQMGFGLHAGKAVQGAIGSQRKIDATYVSEAVERAEFLESSTKKYGLKMLMSGNFHRLLHPNTRRRCRKIDRILLQDDEEDADEDDDELHGELMELFTFDMDVAAIHRPQLKSRADENGTISDSGSMTGDPSAARKLRKGDRRSHGSSRQIRNRRRSVSLRPQQMTNGSEELMLSGPGANNSDSHTRGAPSLVGGGTVVGSTHSDDGTPPAYQGSPELVLPTGPALYSHNIWQSPDMKRIRDKFVQGLFFQKFQSGLQAFYNKDWEMARQCFQTVLENFDDGPSKYFMDQMKKHKGVPPKNFLEYGLA